MGTQSGMRPRLAILNTLLVALGALLTGYFGLAAHGYLVPAAVMTLICALLWAGRARTLFTTVLALNLASGALLILVLTFGDRLGAHKLDVSGVALLLNLLSGGPLLGLVAPGMLLGLRQGNALANWFAPRNAALLRREGNR